MASKKKSLSDSAEAMTAALFGTSEKQEPEETKKAKIATAFPEGSAARSLAEQNEKMLKDGRVRKVTIKKEEPEASIKKSEKVTYGARISKDTITAWKTYIEASGLDAGACTEKALQEYMNRHKLTGIQKQIYDLKMRALDN